MIDKAFAALDRFITGLQHYLSNHYNEADTRVKFIDPFLVDILGWQEHLHIRREERF
jgi:hypothetical protein